MKPHVDDQPMLCVGHFSTSTFRLLEIVHSRYLSTVTPGEQNEDRSRCDGGTQIPLVLAEGLNSVALQFTRNILCGIVAGLQGGQHKFMVFETTLTWTFKIAKC